MVTTGSKRGFDGEGGWCEQQRQKEESHISELGLLGTQQGGTADPGVGCRGEPRLKAGSREGPASCEVGSVVGAQGSSAASS